MYVADRKGVGGSQVHYRALWAELAAAGFVKKQMLMWAMQQITAEDCHTYNNTTGAGSLYQGF